MNALHEDLFDGDVLALPIEAAHSEEREQRQKEHVEHRTVPGHEERRIELEFGGHVVRLPRLGGLVRLVGHIFGQAVPEALASKVEVRSRGRGSGGLNGWL